MSPKADLEADVSEMVSGIFGAGNIAALIAVVLVIAVLFYVRSRRPRQ